MNTDRPPVHRSLPAIPAEPHEGQQWRYARGCRCDACRAAWREYRRDKVREYGRRKRAEELASHPDGCMCTGCRKIRGER